MDFLIKKRRLIQFILGFSIYITVRFFSIPLGYVILFGGFLGIIFGKVFCRWMCPIGYIVESIIKLRNDDKKKALSQYYKLGCPIAWISGYFNKKSIFKIKIDADSCINCSKCDDTCYISTLNKDFSLYKKDKLDPSQSYRCSKCFECIDKCPTNSLKLEK